MEAFLTALVWAFALFLSGSICQQLMRFKGYGEGPRYFVLGALPIIGGLFVIYATLKREKLRAVPEPIKIARRPTPEPFVMPDERPVRHPSMYADGSHEDDEENIGR